MTEGLLYKRLLWMRPKNPLPTFTTEGTEFAETWNMGEALK